MRPLSAGAGALLAALAVAPLALAAPAGVPGIGAGGDALHRALREHVLHTLDGKAFTLASLRGEVVVVNFWASWCPPCRTELPALSALEARLAGRARVVAISIDEDPRNAARFVKSHHLKMTIAQDGADGLAKRLDLQQVPFTMVLGRDGEVAATASGAAELPRIDAAAQRLAAQSPEAEPRPVSQTMEGSNP